MCGLGLAGERTLAPSDRSRGIGRRDSCALAGGAAEWNMVRYRLAPLAAALGALLPSLRTLAGQSMDDARAAYADGRFVEAADMAESIGTLDASILGARSLSVYAHYEATDEDWEAASRRAMRLGEEAIEADPSSAEAHFALAAAIGRYAQGKSAWTALREGLGGRIRNLLEATLELDPGHVGAMVALGCWHADVAAEGRIARMVYGASRDEAVELFERAIALTPDYKDGLYQYGVRLPALDKDRGVARSREMLERAIDLPVHDVQANYVHLEILDGLDALDEG